MRTSLEWISSWLTKRHQIVIVNGEASYVTSVESGVPHLRPFMFLVCINDINENIHLQFAYWALFYILACMLCKTLNLLYKKIKDTLIEQSPIANSIKKIYCCTSGHYKWKYTVGYNNFNCLTVINIIHYSSFFQYFLSIYVLWSLL